jgi:hypothetical protein
MKNCRVRSQNKVIFKLYLSKVQIVTTTDRVTSIAGAGMYWRGMEIPTPNILA